jgi:hypothetical protein
LLEASTRACLVQRAYTEIKQGDLVDTYGDRASKTPAARRQSSVRWARASAPRNRGQTDHPELLLIIANTGTAVVL